MNSIEKILVFIFGIGVLISYYIVFGNLMNEYSYLSHPFWFGLEKNKTLLYIFIFFLLLAVLGFLTALFNWNLKKPTSGILSKYLTPILILFFISATIWPFATFYKSHIFVVLSLIFTAISSTLLLVGSIEDDNPKWWIVLGLIFLNITTILNDGILWNANYIMKIKNGTI